jgi:hypothetical protein
MGTIRHVQLWKLYSQNEGLGAACSGSRFQRFELAVAPGQFVVAEAYQFVDWCDEAETYAIREKDASRGGFAGRTIAAQFVGSGSDDCFVSIDEWKVHPSGVFHAIIALYLRVSFGNDPWS